MEIRTKNGGLKLNEYLNNKTFEFLIKSYQESKKQKEFLNIIILEISETINRKKNRNIDLSSSNLDLKKRQSKLNESNEIHDSFKNKLALAFFTLSENIVRYAKFQLIDFDDAIQEGVMICFDKIDRFDSRKGKAFNYMTTCILNHFRQLYRTARNYNDFKRRYLNHIQFSEGGSAFNKGRHMFDHNSQNSNY
jgi:hypothetical protein